ncbi:MAG: 2-phospho-L-lactate transferase CofD family protein [Actinomycetota bacterium]|nr:2-phospho-L-lactate transferase CofD family protein [Actinomycetota bacterium]
MTVRRATTVGGADDRTAAWADRPTDGPASIVVLSGGLGGARMALALTEAGLADRSTFVTNVADDWTVGGLPVCPDTDAVLYALSGRFDEERGWGIRGDTFRGPRPGEPSWFGIGDLDRAHHEARRELLAAGASRAEATADLALRAGIGARVVPVTNDLVRTRVRHDRRWSGFQEWLVRDRCPAPDAVDWSGLGRAVAAPGVVEAIEDADLVVIGSSSPMASLAPILGVAGVRNALASRRGATVALSPVVLGRPLGSDRDRHRAAARAALMACRGLAHTPVDHARWIASVVSHVAVDASDVTWAPAIADLGVEVILAPVIGIDPDERRTLLASVLSEAALAGAAREPARSGTSSD